MMITKRLLRPAGLSRTLACISCLGLLSACHTVRYHDYQLRAELITPSTPSTVPAQSALSLSSNEGEDGRAWTVESASWRLRLGATGGVGLGAVLENRASHPVCLDLAHARVAVGIGPSRPLPITGLTVLTGDRLTSLTRGKPLGQGPLIEAVPICVAPSRSVRFVIYLDIPTLAPGRATLFEDGPTSTVTYELPIGSEPAWPILKLTMQGDRVRERRVTW